MKSTAVPVFDHYGIRHVIEGFPGSLEDWTLGERTSREHEKFVESLEEALCGVVYQTRLREQSSCQSYEVMLEGGEVYVVHKSQPWMDSEKRAWALSRAACETGILEWLEKRAPMIPAPRVLYAIPDYSILTKAPGKALLECFGAFDVHQKETAIISYAHLAVELFQLDVPQQIGTLSRGSAKDTLTVVPRIGAPPTPAADRVYTSAADYISSLFSAARDVAAAIETTSEGEAQALLAALEARAAAITAGLPARALRCALAKDNLDAASVFVDARTGAVSALDGWAHHALLPRALAATYPAWLRYDGVHDPAFARRGPGAKWWIESPQESARLRALFEQVVRSRSETFYEALVGGAELRAILEWLPQLVEGAPALARLRKWMRAQRIL